MRQQFHVGTAFATKTEHENEQGARSSSSTSTNSGLGIGWKQREFLCLENYAGYE